MIDRRHIAILFVTGLAGLEGRGAERQAEVSPPGWLRSGDPVRVQQVSEKDYPYLEQWVDGQARPAQEYVLRLLLLSGG